MIFYRHIHFLNMNNFLPLLMKFENIDRMENLVKVIILIEKVLSNDEDNHFEVLIVDACVFLSGPGMTCSG